MKTKQKRCRYCHRFMGRNYDESHCVADGWEDDKVKIVTEEECEKCDFFESKFIEYPLTIQGIENRKIDTKGMYETGSLCEISPCKKEYEGKSFLGIYLGDLPIRIHTTYDRKSGILNNFAMTNPAIFVPELKKIIYGMESWWRIIEKPEDFKGISKEDIENTWYVKMLRNMEQKEEDK